MKVRSKKQWFELFTQHQQSGLSIAEFCRNKSLCRKYFSLRRTQLSWKNDKLTPIKKSITKDFIKVSVKTNESSALNLSYGELRLNWQQLPPADWLRDFVKQLP